jgi:alkylation response protein AidB-like acyl-CoA dehydrogenase
MDLRFSAEDEAFRAEVREFLETSLAGEFASARGRGGPGDELALVDERKAWERHLGANGWTCVGWPEEHGGRGLSLQQQVIYHEECVRARAPGRVGHIGETLLGPTVIAYGSAEQQARFLPPIVAGTELWCQGYSEPDAGSDLANIKTRAVLDATPGGGEEWVIDGQKVWTSLAQWSQWCFVLARTNPGVPKHKGISCLLVPMDQPGVEVRPIVQLSRDAEFNETFFDGARTAGTNVVGGIDNGWTVAMGTLALERGVSTLGQNLHFAAELDEVLERARGNGRIDDPSVRQRAVALWTRLQIMRLNALRVMSSTVEARHLEGQRDLDDQRAATVTKLFWANLHQAIGELAMDVLGADATVLGEGGEYTRLQRLFLFSRADTIYGGSDQVQRNIIGERALGLPKEPR